MEYKIIEQNKKKFTIDLGLRAGHDNTAKISSVSDIVDWYTDWQIERADKGLPYFSGIVLEAQFVYAYKKDLKVIGDNEPSARVEGEISSEYHQDFFDDDEKIISIILDLAKKLGTLANQERVHVEYGDKIYLLEKL
ncbi:hypothetical protein COB64_00120 [Candidatus Wolfebacteria bacterium]|nr:MAG: hypothetical protein COB64_00120 [Candidatus Wolfebacteria bacterium]